MLGKFPARMFLWLTVRDHTQNNLNITIATKNKVAEMRMNLEKIHVPRMIHFHKPTREVIYSDLLKETLKFLGYSQLREKLRTN